MNQMVTTDPESPADTALWVDRYGDALYRYALSRLRDSESAEEVVQQTFLAGLEHRSQYSGTGSLQGWLMGILKRKVVDFVRQRDRYTLSDDLGDIEENREPLGTFFDRKGNWSQNVRETLLEPLDSVDKEEFWPIFQKCMGTLPKRQSSAFLLREMEGCESAKICKELGISSSNLWVLLHRARLRLANCIKFRWLQEQDE
ncbi:RNA polymerase sigma factor SigM [Rubripirellula lacrimiformis]|uniref:RNA polymerase sigma factor SigM n=1 Tax=Rubripirellula lacrimiformis TaxID=1930273 RepID=A0A517NEH1_9BACT|nr:sigma-70 family RNA polymerase sigma factor [Rubripirellula lacrimiformis]QDT05534.1 RNA polymerase sigma factor SigM [Rubripirellula lacrimiformis]